MPQLTLNSLDRAILNCLQSDPRISMAALAAQTNSSTSVCWRRIKWMEEQRLIEGYQLTLDRRALGFGIDAFLYVTLESHQDRQSLAFERSLEHIEQILSCYILSGHDDYLLRVVETDLDALARFIRKVVAVLPHVRHVRSAPIMQVVKEARRLPIPE